MTETLKLTIESVGAQGDGVGTHEGMPVYVPMTVTGDKVTVEVAERKRGAVNAVLASIDSPSADRRKPECQHFGACGGCQLQHLGDGFYINWSKERLVRSLGQHGFEGINILEPVVTGSRSRRRVAFKALNTASGVVIGFTQKQSHRIVHVVECPITRSGIMQLLPDLRVLLHKLLPQRGLATLHITETASGLDMLIEGVAELDLDARESLVRFAETHDLAALHWQNESFLDPVAIRREPIMNFDRVKVTIPPAAFVQATLEGEKALVDAVVSACDGYRRVADLFCGLGTFTFPLAHNHQVLAIEGAKAALSSLELARNNAQRIGPKLKQIVTKHRDLFRRPMTTTELTGFDAVVIDPPRAGAIEQMRTLATSSVKRIVAVSCNPNTFARDARILVDGGYRLDSVLPVDQFLWSSHLELVAVFTKCG
ncbi:23S rRNA (uracil(1939)-C(5))-methyltransferase RlmD [Kordiimonas aquimaris]|uniref:23S rRNA (uracil(1939)-C(5))-methyltransferase RlmD n=1 Tax=Kordiimonas aquimaris TaxID=707591 RepID=UPI0021CE4C3B|nr:23S rRNA (uracil(1939)-C(5))-methyltransferase RlmD [Kordiimonas aquimaris]